MQSRTVTISFRASGGAASIREQWLIESGVWSSEYGICVLRKWSVLVVVKFKTFKLICSEDGSVNLMLAKFSCYTVICKTLGMGVGCPMQGYMYITTSSICAKLHGLLFQLRNTASHIIFFLPVLHSLQWIQSRILSLPIWLWWPVWFQEAVRWCSS